MVGGWVGGGRGAEVWLCGGGAGPGRPELLPSPAAALLSPPLLLPPHLAPYSHLFSFCVFLLPHLFFILKNGTRQRREGLLLKCFLWEAHLQKALYLSWKHHHQASSAARTPVPGSRTTRLPPPAPGGYAPGNPWQTILSLPGSQRGWELLKAATDSLRCGITALHKGGGRRVQRKWTGDRYPCQSSC